MTAPNFPTAPTLGDEYLDPVSGVRYRWNSRAWEVILRLEFDTETMDADDLVVFFRPSISKMMLADPEDPRLAAALTRSIPDLLGAVPGDYFVVDNPPAAGATPDPLRPGITTSSGLTLPIATAGEVQDFAAGLTDPRLPSMQMLSQSLTATSQDVSGSPAAWTLDDQIDTILNATADAVLDVPAAGNVANKNGVIRVVPNGHDVTFTPVPGKMIPCEGFPSPLDSSKNFFDVPYRINNTGIIFLYQPIVF